MSVGLEVAPDGLRTRLDEPDWAALVAAANVSARPAGAFAALEPANVASLDEPLVAAAALALGTAPVHLELQTGAGDHGVLAQIGCDAVATGVAVRALVAAPDGSGPVAVPGVEVGANSTQNVVAEIMRLFPGGGLTRHTGGSPVTIPHELSLTLHQAVRSGDDALARLVAQQAGYPEPPDVLVSLARGTTASATLTVRVAGSPMTVVQQWMLCDVGWVLLTVRGTLVTHTAQSRDEVRDSLIRTMAGAFAATRAVSGRG
ncbi:MAG: hypothetical protein ABWX74_07860 [Aeromicrobium sp.]